MDRTDATLRPTKEAIALLPPFERLPLGRIQVVNERTPLPPVLQALAESAFIGFDSETKPVFRADVRAEGPHILQLATLDQAFLFQVNWGAPLALLKEVLESPALVKVGFGLNSDHGALASKLGIHLQGTVDVARLFRPLGYREAVGAKAAVAIVLGQKLQKSKKATTSNWAAQQLTPAQLQYAADDAHAALAVFLAMGCPSLQASGGGQSRR